MRAHVSAQHDFSHSLPEPPPGNEPGPTSGDPSMAFVLELWCQDCPNLWSPPHEVASQGGTATMDFLRDGAKNLEMSLFLIGDGEAGKTSVLRALKSERNVAEWIREDQRTVPRWASKWRLWKPGKYISTSVFACVEGHLIGARARARGRGAGHALA